METKNTAGILFATTVTSRMPPVPDLVLVAKAKLDLVPGGTMTLVEGIPQLVQGPLNHDVYREDDEERSGEVLSASDFAEQKPHGELVLTGACHAPRGRMVQNLAVKVAVGRWSKALEVVGDRRRARDEPARFSSMPLDYAHAYGGPNLGENPVGKGHDDKALPNVIDPRAPSAVASFAPLNPGWPQRKARVGTRYDEAYLEKRFPFYPEDFDWRFFQAAPADQWIDGYWRGDEKLTLHHLHPEHPVLETELPGWRVRAFVHDDRDSFREVAMHLDTIAVDTDSATATLTWRGLTPIRKLVATDVRTVLVVREPLAGPSEPEAVYREQLMAFEADPLELESRLPDEVKEMLADVETDAEATLGTSEEARRLSAMMRDKLGGAMPEEQAKLARRVDELVARDERAKAKMGGLLDEMSQEGAADAIPPYVPIAPGARPRVYVRAEVESARASLANVRRRLEAALAGARGAPREAIQAKLAELDEAEGRLVNPDLEALDPTLRDATAGEPGPGADLSGQDLSERDLRGIDLRGAKLDGAILTRANLRGVDLRGASLDGTVLYRADLTEAELEGADLSRCNAAEAVLEKANLAGCKLLEAYFKGAKMAACRLDRASGRYAGFPEADLSRARLLGAELPDADFQAATLEDADLSRSTLTKAFFRGAVAQRARFDEAKLDQTSFLSADLRGASLKSASGERTAFLSARLDGADLGRATLRGAFFDDSRAPGARFVAADLRDARLCRADLDGASFERANLFGADLSDAEVDRASFVKANLYDAKLLRTGGRDADFSGANVLLARTGGRL